MANCPKCNSLMRKQRTGPPQCIRHGASQFRKLVAELASQVGSPS